jgi:hypothetical protein
MAFTRADLLYNDYYWPAEASGTGPESVDFATRILDRRNGHDMLRCILWCALKLGQPEHLATCQILEIDIRYVVPATVRRYGEILSWLISRYLFLLY